MDALTARTWLPDAAGIVTGLLQIAAVRPVGAALGALPSFKSHRSGAKNRRQVAPLIVAGLSARDRARPWRDEMARFDPAGSFHLPGPAAGRAVAHFAE